MVNVRSCQRSPKPQSLLAGSLLSFIAVGASLNLYASDDVQGHIEVGASYISDKDLTFGNYSGLDFQGLYPILSGYAEQQPRWDSGDADYWSVRFENLGIDSRALSFKGGEYGVSRLSADYSEIASNGHTGGRTVFTNKGADDLRLPSNWVAATSTSGMPGLAGSLDKLDDSIKRKRFAIAYRLDPSTDWRVTMRFKHELKDGVQLRYGVIGNSGGNPRAVALPTPIDYQFNELSIEAIYTLAATVLQFGYEISLFKNEHDAQTWDNPYLAISGWESAAGYPGGRGAIAREPDNSYHKLFGSGFWRLSKSSSLRASAHYARMAQDEDYLPYTTNPGLSVTTPLPAQSLDGQIDIWSLKLGYQNRLTNRLALTANLSHEEKDNKTDQNLYIYIGGDSQNQLGASSDRARYNLPHSTQKTVADAALRYRLSTRSTLEGSLKHSNTERDYSEVEETQEDTAQVTYTIRPTAGLNGSVRVAHSRRDSGRYRGDAPYLATHTAAYVASQPAGERFENHPLLRKYYLADRDRNQLVLGVNITPADQVSLGLSHHLAEDEYNNSFMGLQSSDVSSSQLDLFVAPSEQLSWGAFYSYENHEYRQSARSFRGNAVAADIVDPARDWHHSGEDKVKTLGANIDISEVFNRTDINVSYLISHSDIQQTTTTGSALSALPIPENGDKLIRLAVEFTHYYSDKIQLLFSAAHETYTSKYFHVDNVTVNTMSNVIASGTESPRYSINEFLLSIRYEL